VISPAQVLETAGEWHAAGRNVAIATVVRTRGSSPCPEGSHLVVREDGAFVGSVSAGCVEAAVVARAIEVIASGEPARLEFGPSDERALGAGLACGGAIEVAVEPLGRLLAAGRVRFAEVEGRSVLLDPDRSPSRLFVVGAVHVAQALAPMAAACGHQVVVVDPREAFASAARFPGVALRCQWPDEALRALGLDRRSAVVVLSHDPKLDDPALAVALGSDCFYIGALGSRRTHRRRLDRLRRAGFGDQALGRIQAPVGLAIGARNPPEIAVSILAQVTERRWAEAPPGGGPLLEGL
jgi:xanthine dehydrogenase accessory factor